MTVSDCQEWRGFLRCGTFSAKTKKAPEKQDGWSHLKLKDIEWDRSFSEIAF